MSILNKMSGYSKRERLLTVHQLMLRYGEKIIFQGVNLKVDNIVRKHGSTGQIITLLGPSGVGKSQLMRCIAGLVEPTSGYIKITDKREVVKPGQIGMVQQNYPLFAHRTVLENLTLVNNSERSHYYLDKFGLTQLKDRYPHQLSGGQRQRVAIIQQILNQKDGKDPLFILLDEPFSGLDPKAIEKLMLVLNDVAHESDHNTIIISSHILEPSMAISDTVWFMNRVGPELPATILKEVCLAELGLAWRPDVRKDPRFIKLVEDLRQTYLL